LKKRESCSVRASNGAARCALCERQVKSVSRHHLLPKSKGGKHTETVPLCQPCHSTIHRTFTNKELAENYTTVEALREAENLQKYLNWIKDRPIERISNRRKRK
jgi:hypothetical protein